MPIIIKVVLPVEWSDSYDYYCPDHLQATVGSIVQVRMRNKLTQAVVIDIISSSEYELKHIEKVLGQIPVLYVQYLLYLAKYYYTLPGVFFALAIRTFSKHSFASYYKTIDNAYYTIEELNQQLAHATWKKQIQTQKLEASTFAKAQIDLPFDYLTTEQKEISDYIACVAGKSVYEKILLQGNTGSGKTDVYLEGIAKLALTKQVLILLPEISLTQSFLSRFKKRFGIFPLVWHCLSSATSKDAIYQFALDPHSTGIVIGARSALFLPYANLGMIIIDEEHDGSYKQNDGIRYHTKTCADFLCKQYSIPLVLVSATPAFEHYIHKPHKHFVLNRQLIHGHAKIHLINMKEEKSILSAKTVQALKENKQKKQLSLMFLNRKGFAPIVLCKQCDIRLMCKHCSVGMVYYKTGIVKCHYCAQFYTLPPTCECGSTWCLFGLGIEKLQEQIQKQMPESAICSISSQLNKTELASLHKQLHEGSIDIIIGTKVMAQGHHIEHLSFVCVLDCDFGLSMPSYQAAEQTYQLLTQVRGRSGRSHIAGECFLQTFYPNHPLLQALQQNTIEQWIEQELANRKLFNWPPFTTLISIIIESKQQLLASAYAEKVQLILHNFNTNSELEILGPIQSAIAQIQDIFRYRLLIKANTKEICDPIIVHLQKNLKADKNIKMIIDVHPEQTI